MLEVPDASARPGRGREAVNRAAVDLAVPIPTAAVRPLRMPRIQRQASPSISFQNTFIPGTYEADGVCPQPGPVDGQAFQDGQRVLSKLDHADNTFGGHDSGPDRERTDRTAQWRLLREQPGAAVRFG